MTIKKASSLIAIGLIAFAGASVADRTLFGDSTPMQYHFNYDCFQVASCRGKPGCDAVGQPCQWCEFQSVQQECSFVLLESCTDWTETSGPADCGRVMRSLCDGFACGVGVPHPDMRCSKNNCV